MGKCKPGDIITIKGTEFAVLDVEKGAENGKDKLLVLLKEPFGNTPFSNDGNDYTESSLREKTDQWFEEFSGDLNKKLVFSREISLLTMDGRANYGIAYLLAAPLTFDEWRKYSRYIPDCEREYWLSTGDSAPGRPGAACAMFVFYDGTWGSGSCSNTYAVRPALVVSEELIDAPKDNGLSKFSTIELIQELAERAKMDGGADNG